jgi:hypothetical protein
MVQRQRSDEKRFAILVVFGEHTIFELQISVIAMMICERKKARMIFTAALKSRGSSAMIRSKVRS